MIRKLFGVFLLCLVIFLGYVSTKSGQFRYEKSGLISAPPEKIYPYLASFKLGAQWNPYEKKDPNMKKVYSGTEGQVGSAMDFDGNREVGSGRLEFLKLVPNEAVQIKLTMTKPFQAENLVDYRLAREGNATRFTWAMSGDGGFLGKLMATLIDCEAMVTKDFVVGIENLKTVVESAKN